VSSKRDLKLDDLRRMSDMEVRNLNLGRRRRRRGRYKRHPREKMSRKELIAYLRKTGITTQSGLRASRGEGDPTDYDYQVEFGSWTRAREIAFGIDLRLPVDQVDVAESIVRFKLWSREGYLRFRNAHMSLPSYHAIRKKWGSWSNLVHVARRVAVSAALEKYMSLMRRFGRLPTEEECRDAGLSMADAVEFFGSKAEMDEYVSGLKGVV